MCEDNSLELRLQAEASLPPRHPEPVFDPEDWFREAPASSDAGGRSGGPADADSGDEAPPWANEEWQSRSGELIAADGPRNQLARFVRFVRARLRVVTGRGAGRGELVSERSLSTDCGVAQDVAQDVSWVSGVAIRCCLCPDNSACAEVATLGRSVLDV